MREKLDPLPDWQIGFYSFCQDKDSSLNSEEGRQTLSDVGILSCDDVGVWLETELRDYLKEEGIAERLKNFLASESKYIIILPHVMQSMDFLLQLQMIVRVMGRIQNLH